MIQAEPNGPGFSQWLLQKLPVGLCIIDSPTKLEHWALGNHSLQIMSYVSTTLLNQTRIMMMEEWEKII